MVLDQSQVPVLEIAHVLFMDIVSYSVLPMDEQQKVLRHLQHAVRDTSDFRRAQNSDQLIRLPTGDGMALVFFGDPEAPARCAVELSCALRTLPEIQLRMGIHTGPVYRLADINLNRNVSGGGINLAQRVMDCGDANHILVSAAVAEVLGQISNWEPTLHDLGEVAVKHGVHVHLFNLYTPEAGNPEPPRRLRPAGVSAATAHKEPSPAALDTLIGNSIGNYRVLRKLGSGGMGVIYEAEDIRLGRHVALKFLPEHLLHDTQAVERFRREATLASVLNHPHICTLHDIGEHNGRAFLVLELLEGRSLKEHLEGGAIELPRVLEWGIQISDALQMAHSRGIVHRDIKPGNIFITERGQAKILDFGLAKFAAVHHGNDAAQEMLTAPGVPLGTVAYMSPEQARGEELDAGADVFSLGAVLYEMTTGHLPFEGNTSAVMFDAILNRTPTAPVRLKPDIPPELQRIINQALEKDRGRRYRSAGDIAADLRCLQRVLDSSAQAPAQALLSVAPARDYIRPLLYAGIAVVAIGLTISLLWHTRAHDVESGGARPTAARPATHTSPVSSQPPTSSEAATNTPSLNAPPRGLAPAQTGSRRDQSAANKHKPPIRSSTVRAAAPSSSISGLYSGSLEMAASASQIPATALLVEQSGIVRGCLRLSPPLRGSGPVHGVSHGAQILVTVFFAGGRTELQGRFAGDELRGQYTIVDSGVLRQGAFSLRLQTTPVQSVSFDASSCPTEN